MTNQRATSALTSATCSVVCSCRRKVGVAIRAKARERASRLQATTSSFLSGQQSELPKTERQPPTNRPRHAKCPAQPSQYQAVSSSENSCNHHQDNYCLLVIIVRALVSVPEVARSLLSSQIGGRSQLKVYANSTNAQAANQRRPSLYLRSLQLWMVKIKTNVAIATSLFQFDLLCHIYGSQHLCRFNTVKSGNATMRSELKRALEVHLYSCRH
jgi:hypothetical protein